ncbi:TonB-dependent receptor plug domain-containing protein [Ponticaulis profundi]|uniref:TonB-dependent receptor plug domain-containing protein n=1 Tax=Ponticaulis profundi TaxID=2665222 RepID=A0ABW1S9P4_9PROT
MKRVWLMGTVGVIALASFEASAQSTASEPVDLGEIDIVETEAKDDAPAKAYESFDPIDTGTSTISAKSIEAENQGDIDTTELLRKLPNVQLSLNSNRVTQSDLQNIRPSDFVISGGNYYNNNIMVDGVQANAIGDVTESNPAALNEVAGQTAQTFYVDPSLIGEITVRDSNISAEYGDFTGGVVEYELRKPGKEFGVSITSSYQDESLVSYKVADEYRGEDGEVAEAEPEFSIKRYSITADLPVTEDFSLLAGYTRAQSNVGYQMNETYDGTPFDSSDTSQNFLLKALYEITPNLTFEGQVSISPYVGEFESDNRTEDYQKTHSDGLSSYLKLSGLHAGWDWEGQFSFSKSNTEREWDGKNNFSWPSAAPSVDWCSRTNCTSGGFGDLDQTQEDYALKFRAERALASGLLRLGGEVRDTSLEKIRSVDSNAFLSGVVASPLDCNGDTIACIEDEVFLTRRMVYQAYDAEVDVTNEALWAEYERDIADVTLRGGLRYSHDSFLDNNNLAPRVSASWQFRPDWFLTFGANRYYAKNMVAYAIRSQYPDSYSYERDAVVDENGVVSPGDWYLTRHTRSTDYAQAALDTPFSDELTAALTIPTPFNGNFRLKAVHRDGKDEFARSPSDTVTFDEETGTSTTTRLYTVTNNGESEYNGVSAEWSGSYENHALSASLTWSETHRRGGIGDYFDEIDEDALVEDLLYYDGRIITEQELYEITNTEDFATPILASVIWSSKWFQERLSTTVGVYYRGEYETIDDTYENIEIDGVRYDVFDEITIDPYTSVNLNAALEIFDTDAGRGVLDIRVENLLDDLPHTATTSSNPYQMGRSVWLGFNYRY